MKLASTGYPMSFGSRLRQERDVLGLTQQKFAELGGVKRVSQHLYEQDVRAPDMNYLSRLKEHGVDVWFLIHGTRISQRTSDQLPRSIYVSAFRAVEELALDRDGQALPLQERERLFTFLLSLLERESPPASPDALRSRLLEALAS